MMASMLLQPGQAVLLIPSLWTPLHAFPEVENFPQLVPHSHCANDVVFLAMCSEKLNDDYDMRSSDAYAGKRQNSRCNSGPLEARDPRSGPGLAAVVQRLKAGPGEPLGCIGCILLCAE